MWGVRSTQGVSFVTVRFTQEQPCKSLSDQTMSTKVITVLGIETSCDETAVAVVNEHGKILSNVVHSQLDEHSIFGGVVPEIAARAHVSLLDALVDKAMAEARLDPDALSGVAATAGPGLIGGVLVGLVTGKALAAAWDTPFIGVNHLEGHALTPRLTHGVAFPYVVLLVSGGHSQIILAQGVGQYVRLGTTIDDAVGEAFDKTAKILGLGYPGGPAVESMAQSGDPQRFKLPRPMVGKPGCHFSFSGLKTAVRRHVEALGPKITATDKADLCASFQTTVADVIGNRLTRGLEQAAHLSETPITALVAAGGVAANTVLRSQLETTAHNAGVPFVVPPPALCTDNGAMIAWAGLERLQAGITDPLDIPARARWPLDPNAAPAPGAGVKA